MIGFKELLIIAVIIALLFGTSKLRNIGTDIGTAIKNFKKASTEGEDSAKTDAAKTDDSKTENKS